MIPRFAIGAAVALGGLFVAKSAVAQSSGEGLPDPEIPSGEIAQSNLGAFLAVIRRAESGDNYKRVVAGGVFLEDGQYIESDEFDSYETHPAIGEGFVGIVVGTKRDGSPLYSTAAGAYQIVRATFDDLMSKYQFPGPNYFSPANQDAMAIRLIMRRGAFDAVIQGDMQRAQQLLSNEWQSLTLPKYTGARLVALFQQSGGFA